MTLGRYLIKRSAIFVGTLLVIMFLTIVLVGPMNDTRTTAIIRECNDEASKIKFATPNDHDIWIKNCIEKRM
jgi:hypothetical protein